MSRPDDDDLSIQLSPLSEKEPSTDQDEPDAKRQRLWSQENDNETIGKGEYKGKNIGCPQFQLNFWEEGKDEKTPYSDWMITVESSCQKRTFGVHQPVLAAVSDYFEAIFTGGFTEPSKKCSSFEFPELVVQHFEVLLKYAYKDVSIPWLGSAEVCTLLYLSDYFQMVKLNISCREYLRTWRRNHERIFCDIAQYYETSEQLNLPFLWEFMTDWCVNNLGRSHHNEDFEEMALELLQKMDPGFFVKVFRNPEKRWKYSKWLNQLALVCKHHKVEANSFLELIQDKSSVPQISGHGALTVLNMLQHYLEVGKTDAACQAKIDGLKVQYVQQLHLFFLFKNSLKSFDDDFDLAKSLHKNNC
ncbi:MAG: hypothetical protein SGARI_001771 [Bacillariaceae sp.]